MLDAEKIWVVEGSATDIRSVVTDLGEDVCKRVTEQVARLEFGNSVGRVHRAGPLGPLVVRSGKWTDKDYDHMLGDLCRTMAALPFASATPTSLPFARSELDAPEILFHAFVWLRHALLRDDSKDLHGALEGILRDPHRRLVRTSRIVPVELAGRFSGRALDDVASGRWPMLEHRRGFAVGDRRVLPMRVAEDYSRENVDTAENRFVLSFLDECVWVVGSVRDLLRREKNDNLENSVRPDCEKLEQILAGWRRASMWSEVGAMTHFPASSSVLQRRHEYRTVLHHHLMLRLGSRVPLDNDTVRSLLESKNIAALYELWATFTVLEEVTAILGPPDEIVSIKTSDLGAGVRQGAVVSWKAGRVEVAYNPSFTHSKSNFHSKSRSLEVRPDIALYIKDGPNCGLHLFDAKFRVDGTLDPDAVSDGRKPKSGDIHKMHAYRDIIPDTRTAWVVYPGSKVAVFWDDGRRDIRCLDKGEIAGVGALPLQPGGHREELKLVLAAVLHRQAG